MNNINNPMNNFENSVEISDDFSKIETVNVDSNFRISVPVSFQKKIEYLHTRFPGKEWSGFGFAKYNQDSIDSNLVVELVDFYPLHLGTSTFTSFEQTEEFAGFMADNLDYMNYKLVYIHTHHNMGAFHSGTDTNTLKRLTVTGNNVLFLVVDTRNTWWGHISVLVEAEIANQKRLIKAHGYDINNNKIDYFKDIKDLTNTTEIRRTMLLHKGVMEFAPYEESLGGFTALADKIENDSKIQANNTNYWTNSRSFRNTGSIVSRATSTQPSLFDNPNYGIPDNSTFVWNVKASKELLVLDEDYFLQEVEIYKHGVLLFGISYLTVLFLNSIFKSSTKFLITKLDEVDIELLQEDWVSYFFDGMRFNYDYDSVINKTVSKLQSQKPEYFELVYMEVESLLEEVVEFRNRDEEISLLEDIMTVFRNVEKEDENSPAEYYF